MAAVSLDHAERLVEVDLDLAAVGLRDRDLVAIAAEVAHYVAGAAAAADALLRGRLRLRRGVARHRLLGVLVRGTAVPGNRRRRLRRRAARGCGGLYPGLFFPAPPRRPAPGGRPQ